MCFTSKRKKQARQHLPHKQPLQPKKESTFTPEEKDILFNLLINRANISPTTQQSFRMGVCVFVKHHTKSSRFSRYLPNTNVFVMMSAQQSRRFIFCKQMTCLLAFRNQVVLLICQYIVLIKFIQEV